MKKSSLQSMVLAVAFTGASTESLQDPSNIRHVPCLSLEENKTITVGDENHLALEHNNASVVPDNPYVTKRPKSSRKKASTTSLSDKSSSKPTTAPSPVSSSASASLRRIKKEYKDAVQMGICYDWVKGRLITSATTKRNSADVQLICIGPLATNLRHWHFSFRGVKNSLYESGIYHGVIVLPKDYPATPPRVQLWTPSGRFKPFVDICLSASAYHPESWTPRWTVLSLVHALRLHMLTNPQEIGGITSTAEEILEYARRSLTWRVSWMTGKRRITVDHGKLLEQGALSLDLEKEEIEVDPTISESKNVSQSTIADNEVVNQSVDYSIAEDSEAVNLQLGRIKEMEQAWSDQKHAMEAVETLEISRTNNNATKQRRKVKSKGKTKEAPTPSHPESFQQSNGGLHMLLMTINSIFATPYRRGLFFLFLLWLLARP